MRTSIDYQKFAIYAALFSMGYVTSLFLTYGFIVMPGLATIDDAAFVAAFQGLETRFQNINNQSVLKSAVPYGNIPASIAFPGSILFTIIALFLKRKVYYAKWLVFALVFFAIGMVTTVMYNLPANEFIFTAGDPALIDASKVRLEFNEVSWRSWNHFRTLTSFLAFLCLMRALNLLRSSSLNLETRNGFDS